MQIDPVAHVVVHRSRSGPRERIGVKRILAPLVLCLQANASAEVVHDGSLGRTGMIASKPTLIKLDDSGLRGKVAGQNLFYSFSRFDVPTGEKVRFVTPATSPPIRNVLARVT